MAFRRQPVPAQVAQALRTATIPAPTRGIVMNENEAFMMPGGANVQDNWYPTMRGIKLRGGTIRWCDLHALDAVVPPVPSALRLPVISAFEYVDGNQQRMFAGQATKLFDVTANTPVLIKSGQASGNYSAAQLANMSGNYMVVVNDGGDFVLRTSNGTTFVTLTGVPGAGGGPDGVTNITYDPAKLPAGVTQGKALVYVWKYRNRLFFIQQSSMNAWYLPIDSVGGVLQPIPLSGAATRGGKLLWGASWSIDAGDGIDDKCVFATDLGELLIFTGSDPGNVASWRQEGRYAISPPMGMNAHLSIGGDLMMASVDGIVPISAAITKTAEQLELAALTRTIKPMWRDEVNMKRVWSWTMEKWDEMGIILVTWPGGVPGKRYCAAVNAATGAWCRLPGIDATCFVRLRADCFFGNQDGIIMQMERTGYDHMTPYVATLVGGWEMFRSGAAQTIWHQARATFTAHGNEPFEPQLDATVDYVVVIPQPPPPGPDPGLEDVWDQGLWDAALWDQPSVGRPAIRNTMWVSIGKTGFSHAPILQATIAQQATPNVEVIAIDATYERAGVNV